MNLADAFSEDFKRKFAERNIEIGNACLIRIPGFQVGYAKYIVIVAETDDKILVGFTVINSVINPNIFPTAELQALHVPIGVGDHDFLEYDSFVDCSTLHEITKENIIELIENDPTSVVGSVSDATLRSIHDTIATARTISRAQRRKFGFL